MTSPMHSPLQSPLQPVMRSPLEFRRRVGFDPESLFRNGEVGVYYDPSDMSTLYQDSAGTTPVTAAGQTVGLMLDKSQGLALGPELVISPYTGTASGSWVISASSIERNGTTAGTAILNIGPTSSKYVVVEFDLADYSGDTLTISVGGVGNCGNITTAGHKSFILPSGTVGEVLFIPWAGAAGQATITNISVKLLAGNHASQSDAGKRPLLKSTSGKWWLDFDVIDDELIATFPSSLGSACTIGKALNPASTIAGAQTIGTTYTMNADNFSTVITNDALTADETAKLQTWLDKKAGNV